MDHGLSAIYICRTWRYAALESGALWANIKIESVLERENNGDFAYNVVSQNLLALMSEALTRSRALGLHITISFTEARGVTAVEIFRERETQSVFSYLFHHVDRIVELDVIGDFACANFFTDSIIGQGDAFRALQRLKIWPIEHDDEEDNLATVDFFHLSRILPQVSTLTEVHFACCLITDNIDNGDGLPWAPLQTFKYDSRLYPSHVVKVLQLCPLLKTFHCLLVLPGHDTGVVNASHEHLHTLRTAWDGLANPLRSITLPALKRLACGDISDLPNCISRSRCNLESLAMKLYTGMENHLSPNLLAQLPYLTDLHIFLDLAAPARFKFVERFIKAIMPHACSQSVL
jgi:hypothetical protein